MKKTLALLSALLMIATLSACRTQTNTPKPQPPQTQTESGTNTYIPAAEKISKERAIELAFETAGIDRAMAFNIEAELDYERGSEVWEVNFETRDHEYSYDIDAYDGTVTKADREIND